MLYSREQHWAALKPFPSLLFTSSLISFLLLCFFQKSPSSMLESWVYIDDQHSMADSTTTPMFTFPTTLVTHRPCLLKSGQVNAAVSNSMTDTCSAFSPLCSPTGSAWDALRSTSKTPGCCDRDPVSAAAHLHLLGESLSLIGQHLRETDVSRLTEDKTQSLYCCAFTMKWTLNLKKSWCNLRCCIMNPEYYMVFIF